MLCPAFVPIASRRSRRSDCGGVDSFLEAGGEALTLVPCLNEHPLWLQASRADGYLEISDAAAVQGTGLRAQGLGLRAKG